MMKKTVAVLLGAGLLSQQAFAVTESITGESFAGYTNSVIGSSGSFLTDLGSATTSTSHSGSSADINASITDTSAGTNIIGTSAGAYLDLGFDQSIFDGAGDDLKLFFVGNNGHNFDVTIGGVTKSYSLGAGEGDTGFNDTAYPTDPIIAMAIDLASFGGLTGSYDQMRLTIGDGYTSDSAVASFVGTYNTTVVPVPAAVWLFGSGLIGLVGLMRRRKS